MILETLNVSTYHPLDNRSCVKCTDKIVHATPDRYNNLQVNIDTVQVRVVVFASRCDCY